MSPLAAFGMFAAVLAVIALLVWLVVWAPSRQAGVRRAERRKRDTLNAGYILGFKTEPGQCGISCLCTVDGTAENRAEIERDALFERTDDAADRGDE